MQQKVQVTRMIPITATKNDTDQQRQPNVNQCAATTIKWVRESNIIKTQQHVFT